MTENVKKVVQQLRIMTLRETLSDFFHKATSLHNREMSPSSFLSRKRSVYNQVDIIDSLWKKNLIHVLQKIWKNLDSSTLFRCERSVCNNWTSIFREIRRIFWAADSNKEEVWFEGKLPSIELKIPARDGVKFLESDDSTIVFVTVNGSLVVFDRIRERLLYNVEVSFTYPTTALSTNDHWVATGSTKGVIRIWQKRNGKLVNSLRHHKSEISCIVVTKESILLALSLSGTLSVTDFVKSRWLTRVIINNPQEESPFRALAASTSQTSDCKIYFSTGGSIIRVWRLLPYEWSRLSGQKVKAVASISEPSIVSCSTLSFMKRKTGLNGESDERLIGIDKKTHSIVIVLLPSGTITWRGNLRNEIHGRTLHNPAAPILDVDCIKMNERDKRINVKLLNEVFYFATLSSNSEMSFWRIRESQRNAVELIQSWKLSSLSQRSNELCTPTCLSKRVAVDDYGFLVGSSEFPAVFSLDFAGRNPGISRNTVINISTYFDCPQCGIRLPLLDPSIKTFHFLMTCPLIDDSRQVMRTKIRELPSIGGIFMKMTIRNQFGLLLFGDPEMNENDLRTVQTLVEIFVQNTLATSP